MLFSSSPVPSSRSTAETLLSPRSFTTATSVGLSSGTAGTYQLSLGSAFTPPATASISPFTSFLQLAAAGARPASPCRPRGRVHFPALIAATMVPLQTPLQSQIWCESGRSASDASFFSRVRGEEEFEPALGDGRAGLEHPHEVVGRAEVAEQARGVHLAVADDRLPVHVGGPVR